MNILYLNTLQIWRRFTPQWRRAGNENINHFESELIQEPGVENLYVKPFYYMLKENYGRPVSINEKYRGRIDISDEKYCFIMTTALAPDMLDIAFAPFQISSKVKKVIWLIDGWLKDWNNWIHLISEYKIDLVFCAYLRNVEWLRREGIKAEWLPFGVHSNIHDAHYKKKYDIVQMGRKRRDYDAILQNSNLVYKTADSFKFKKLWRKELSYEQYFDILAKSKFTLCYPSGTELDEEVRQKTIGFSPTNMRWFECMAATSLPIGETPSDEEFERLFPKERVFIIKTTPRKILDDIKLDDGKISEECLNNFDFVMREHAYRNRVSFVLRTLEKYSSL